MIELQEVSVHFGGVVALDRLSVRMAAPVTGIIGPNGAGKTTLMNAISGFVRSSGTVRCHGEVISALPPHRRARWGLRRSFQREQIADDLSVADNVSVVLDQVGMPSVARREMLSWALATVGLEARAQQLAAGLNRFERRLCDVARCLVARPRLVMFDEPAGGLDPVETAHLRDLMAQVHTLTGAAVVVIDHDVELIRALCTETLVLDFGQRIAFGPTDAVLADPRVRAAYLGVEETGPESVGQTAVGLEHGEVTAAREEAPA